MVDGAGFPIRSGTQSPREFESLHSLQDIAHVAELHTATRYERGGWGLESLRGY